MTLPLDHITQITLPAQLTDAQQRLLVKYARLPRSLARAEWPQALAAFDLLHEGRVLCGAEMLSFQRFYLRAIDEPHATSFLEELLAAPDVEAEGRRLLAEHWRKISVALTGLGAIDGTTEGRFLLMYCLYWWQSFGKGYIREVAVFRDLKHAGIIFEAHDLRDPAARRSAYDLTILERRGDIKTSTYFIHTARAFPLRYDFYLVRLWNEETNRWLDLALLKPETWRELNGEPTPCAWESVARLLPAVLQVVVRGENLIVAPYEVWQERVLRKQSSLQREESNE